MPGGTKVWKSVGYSVSFLINFNSLCDTFKLYRHISFTSRSGIGYSRLLFARVKAVAKSLSVLQQTIMEGKETSRTPVYSH